MHEDCYSEQFCRNLPPKLRNKPENINPKHYERVHTVFAIFHWINYGTHSG